MKNFKKLGIIILFIIIIILIFIIFFFDWNKSDNDDVSDNPGKQGDEVSYSIYDIELPTEHMGVSIEEILSEENYEKVGVNPENYETIEDFVIENECIKEKKGLDFVNESFVISLEEGSGAVYIPYNLKNQKELFSEEIYKNLAILDIFTACKEDSIVGGKDSGYGYKVVFDYEYQHPKTEEFNRILQFDVNVYDYIEELENIESIGFDSTEFLSYLYEFTGDYEKAMKNREKECEEFLVCKEDYIKVELKGSIFDTSGNPVSGAKVELLNNPSSYTLSKVDGTYELVFEADRFSYLRFKVSKEGMSDSFGKYNLNKVDYPSDVDYPIINFLMHSPDERVSIREENYTEYKLGKYYMIETEYSKYFIPIEGLYYENGEKYAGKNIDIYIYQFNKDTNMDNFLENDTFNPVYGYVGNIMKTFGMPYIQFFDADTDKELFIYSSNPMILQNQIYHMKELYENYDQIYTEVTLEDMEYLYNYSQENEGYPITYDFLIENKFLRWPVRWSLDRKAGTWESVPSRLLNTGGLVELPFYSINDTK